MSYAELKEQLMAEAIKRLTDMVFENDMAKRMEMSVEISGILGRLESDKKTKSIELMPPFR